MERKYNKSYMPHIITYKQGLEPTATITTVGAQPPTCNNFMIHQWLHSDSNVNHTHRPSLIMYQHNLELEIALKEITFKAEICNRIKDVCLRP